MRSQAADDGSARPRRQVIAVVVAAVAATLVIVGVATGAGPFGCDREPEGNGISTNPEPITDFIVAFDDDSTETRESVLDDAGDQVGVTLEVVREMGLEATVVVQASEPLDESRQRELIEAIIDTCQVRYAEPDFVMQTS